MAKYDEKFKINVVQEELATRLLQPSSVSFTPK
jgi:hypothetical protein